MSKDNKAASKAATWDKGYCALDPLYAPEQVALMARLRNDVSERLWGKRLKHSFGVAATALWLA